MRKFNRLCLALLCAFAPASFAEDTDIYAAQTSSATNPNVLIVIDNSANWASASQHWPGGIKQGQSELNALRTVIAELGTNVNVGLMMFTPGSGTAKDGGYIRYHMRPMNETNRNAFRELIGNGDACTDGANSLNATPNCIYKNFASGPLNENVGTAKTDYSAVMFEVFKYFGGYTSPDHARDGVAGTPTNASHFGAYRYAGDPETRSDAAAYSGGASLPNYVSPISDANGCAKNYIIFIGNGYPTQDSPSTLLTEVGGSATQLNAPDFVDIAGVAQTLLGTGVYSSQEACEAAAATAYGASYDSYTCSNPSVSTSTVGFGTSTCGQYGSVGACQSAITAAHPGYSNYTCTAAASCSGETALGVSTCGQYSTVEACRAGAATVFPGFTSYSCTSSALTCTESVTTLATSTCGQYATSGTCQTAAATLYPGYASYACTSAGSCTTNLGGTSCYATSSACQSAVLASNSGYNSVSCGSATNCSSVITTTCAAAGSYSSQASCDAAASDILGATYASYGCTQGATCASGKTWTITGTNQSYTATGNGTRWTMTGTNPAGTRYDMVGVGGGSTYAMTATSTTTTWSIYGNRNVITAVPTGTFTTSVANYADEWAKYLYQTDVNAATGQQNVRTYAIDVFKDLQDSNQTKLLMSMANQGGGKYFTATDESAIANALRRIFSEIQSVNSVFASSSLPVSVNTQGTYLNQVFIGMFRPDGTANPRWAGNLKQYQFKIDSSTSKLLLSDKNSHPAISATTGFITPCADSMWTTDTGTYWNFGSSNAMGSCSAEYSAFPAANSTSIYSDAPDGDVVEKGGAAQKLRGVLSSSGALTSSSTRYSVCGAGQSPATASCRKLLTCNNASCSTLLEFSTSNAGSASSNPSLTATNLGVADDTERDALINWVRGQDNNNENANGLTNEVRPSVHGAVVHSQPAVVDYGGDTGVYAFYGADDGVFHAVDGGKTDAEGTEVWGFIAPETYDRLKRFKQNEPLVNFPTVNMTITPTPQPKSYFFDGSVGVYQKSSTVWIFATMRRGGRAIYAFDVSTPTSPTLKWRKGCYTNSTTNDSNCSDGWSAIGQTWSKPQVAYLRGFSANGVLKPVLIFGGGYDACEDTNSQSRCGSTPRKGANVWFVDADTGAIIRKYPTNYSVPGDVFVVKDGDGYATHVYATDSGGYVYRVNVGTLTGSVTNGEFDGDFTNWTENGSASNITLAYLSETNHQRKFLFGPDVVRYATYNAILIGSGDREHPLVTDYACNSFAANASPQVPGSFVTNQFFMIKDTLTTYPATPITPANLTDVTTDSKGETTIGSYGWRFNLGSCEQVVNKALSIGGLVFFGTNQPSSTVVNACTNNLGVARGYSVGILNGMAPYAMDGVTNDVPACAGCYRSTTYQGGGLPPSPVAGVVEVDGIKVPFLLGGSTATTETNCTGEACSPLGGTKVEINPAGSRYRTYWYIEKD